MSFRSSSSRVDDRTQSLNILLTRLRRSVSPQSSLEMQIRYAYTNKEASVPGLRSLIRQVAANVPSGSEFVKAAESINRRKHLVELMVTMLETAGHNESNPYRGDTSMSLPGVPMPRAEMQTAVANYLMQQAMIDPPYPYPVSAPEKQLVMPTGRVEYSQRLGIVTPSPVEGRVMCPNKPDSVLIDHINVVSGIKHVKDFYEGNVIYVMTPYHKFRDSAEKCYFFDVLRETFNQYRREYAEHDAADRAWWKRRVRTPWMVYFSDGCHSFDGDMTKIDDRDIIDNDMVINLDKVGVFAPSGVAGITTSGYITASRGTQNTIYIRLYRFDGRNNVGHVRTYDFVFDTNARTGSGPQVAATVFCKENLLDFFYKSGNYRIYAQDFFKPDVRRMIIANGGSNWATSQFGSEFHDGQQTRTPVQLSQQGNTYLAENNKHANERAIKFIKLDPRHAIFVISYDIMNNSNKEFGNVLRSINNFCAAGQEGYDKLAVVIMIGYNATVESQVSVSQNNFVENTNKVVQAIAANPPSGIPCFESYDYKKLSDDPEQLKAYRAKPDDQRLKLPYLGTAAYHSKIVTPYYQLIYWKPMNGFFQLVQKHRMDGEMMISDNEKQNCYIEQIALNKPIFIDEAVLRGFTNPDYGKYFYGPYNPDSLLFIAKVDKLALVQPTATASVYVLPNKLPQHIRDYLRNGARDGASIILGIIDNSKTGSCVDSQVQQWADRNDISAELLPASNFLNVNYGEYVYVRTQYYETTGTVVMYQYLFRPGSGQMSVLYDLENATSIEKSNVVIGGFTDATIYQ